MNSGLTIPPPPELNQPSPHSGKEPNRLIREKSPYLLQHAFNPVDWYPWGDEAFLRAASEDKPIFLSIGYSTCYWCHVMEREVFENDAIARLMNEKLVCIKVDREERPDIDRVYMNAVQAMTGSGGWPMSVFMTPDRKPFFGGTYIPPTAQYGRPGFPDLVTRIDELWHTDQAKLIDSGEQIVALLRHQSITAGSDQIGESVLDLALERLARGFDSIHAGFGSGPKFPRPSTFNFLFRYHVRTGNKTALDMTLATLRAMAKGGMYDQIGGGFHRYSVDGEWRVPHFEKMLYDQAQLAVSYLEAFQITRDFFFETIARDILASVMRDLTSPEGGCYSAQDAESAADPSLPQVKAEGEFALWTKGEIERLLGQDAAIVNFYYGIEEGGNALHDPHHMFVGKNIPYVAHSLEATAGAFHKTSEELLEILSKGRATLFENRRLRPRPHLDDKIITAWNGLMISAFSKAYQILADEQYLVAAKRSAEFISTRLYDDNRKKLLRRYRDGDGRFDGGLQDYTFFVAGLIDLYEASFDIRWLKEAIAHSYRQLELFHDPTEGGFFDALDDPQLIVRTKEDYDGAEPTGNSVAASNFLRLGQITNSKEWRLVAEKTISAFGSRLKASPEVLPEMLAALSRQLATPSEVIVAGTNGSPDTNALLNRIRSEFLPFTVLLLADGSEAQNLISSYLPFVRDMTMINEKAAAYLCQNYACQLPTTDPMELSAMLKQHPLRPESPRQ